MPATSRRPLAPALAASAGCVGAAWCFLGGRAGAGQAPAAPSPALRAGHSSHLEHGADAGAVTPPQGLPAGFGGAGVAAAALAACAHFVHPRQPRLPRRASAEPTAKAEPPEAQASAAKRAPPRPATPPPPPRFDPTKTVGVTAPLGFFDPIGICPKDETVFNEYRACELKHGRVAMLAALGAVAQHYIRLPGFTLTNFGKPMPSGLSAVTETPGTFGFVVLLGVCGALELFLWNDGIDVEAGKWTKEPGNFGDPLGLGQYNEDMRNRELNNGRFAMFAAFGIIAAELLTGKDAVQQVGL